MRLNREDIASLAGRADARGQNKLRDDLLRIVGRMGASGDNHDYADDYPPDKAMSVASRLLAEGGSLYFDFNHGRKLGDMTIFEEDNHDV